MERKIEKISETREKQFDEGIHILYEWVLQLLKDGLAILQHDTHRIQELSSRMVDAGLSGVARKWRTVPEKIKHRDDWVEFTAVLLGESLWLCNQWQQWDLFSENEKQDALTFAGVPVRKADVVEKSIVSDYWLCVGQVKEKEEQLTVIRTWFVGLESHRIALVLEFEVNRFVSRKNFRIGAVYYHPCSFYPSASPVRVVDMNDRPENYGVHISHIGKSLDDILNQTYSPHIPNIFFRQKLWMITGATCFYQSNKWYFATSDGRAIEIMQDEDEIWKIYAWSFHHDSLFFGEWNGQQIKLFSVGIDNQIYSIQ
jgi:hypothetical protein